MKIACRTQTEMIEITIYTKDHTFIVLSFVDDPDTYFWRLVREY